jgi:hypothetical protein
MQTDAVIGVLPARSARIVMANSSSVANRRRHLRLCRTNRQRLI